ncbi:hypothetical protein A9R05_45350 (plasmid) [Burkholderia sp. KK1]|nr:hypothetical protein A9R05_45350 [Burkholderia sp. KK1]
MHPSPLQLVEIHDTDDDHEVGGQDLPYLVTAVYRGEYPSAAALIQADEALNAFNIQAAESRFKLPGHVEFCTFEYREIYRFFGVPRPMSPERELARRYWQSTYARTVGELRAAFADLPDDFPLIHTGHDDRREATNRLGVHVTTNTWEWTAPERAEYGRYAGWAMRVGQLANDDWKQVASGTWKDKRYNDIE